MKEKSVSKLIAECQIVFNEYIRLRDAGKGCISCDSPTFTDCGHLFKKSTRPAMRFNPMAAAGQCRSCNSLPDGNYDAFCEGIYKRYGADYLQTVIQTANNSRQTDHKWSRSELQELIKYFKSEIKKLKR
jgi:hypothetical protein